MVVILRMIHQTVLMMMTMLGIIPINPILLVCYSKCHTVLFTKFEVYQVFRFTNQMTICTEALYTTSTKKNITKYSPFKKASFCTCPSGGAKIFCVAHISNPVRKDTFLMKQLPLETVFARYKKKRQYGCSQM